MDFKSLVPDNSVFYSHSFVVKEEAIDNLNHVNNVVYLQWLNDIAEIHWNILSTEALRAKYVWVVLRHELDYMNQALLGDEITVVTWVGQSTGAKSVRHVHMFKGEIPLLKAASTWCLIDAVSQRPTRIKNDILTLMTRS